MCIDQWQACYTQGDLNNRETLSQALAYQNYMKSPSHVQDEAIKIMQGRNCDELLKESIHPGTEQCCLGITVPFEGPVAYFVIKKKSLFPMPAPSANLLPEDLLDNVLNKIRRSVLFISDWTDEEGNQVLPPPDHVDCGELAQALGLCGTTWKTGLEITILALRVTQAHKSTWLDSGLAFFWYAAPHQSGWGLTRSLKTGRPALREWVLPKQAGAFGIEAYWNLKVEQDCDLRAENLSVDYWDACAKELRP